jgi:hypothetical protein
MAAQAQIGLFYSGGLGVPKDMAKAAYWYELAAQQGDPDAQYQTAGYYMAGQGVAKDPAKAAEWFRKSAEGGNTMAALTYGRMLKDGVDVTKDEAEARKWLTAAAGSGGPEANLAKQALNGLPKTDAGSNNAQAPETHKDATEKSGEASGKP